MLYDAKKFDGGDVPDILANLLSQPKQEEQGEVSGPLSILKNFAKTIFNKCSGAKAEEPKLTPMEQAKFDAAQKMMREGKTTRYAYYKFKEEFEQPILQDYRAVFEASETLSEKKRDLSDWAMRKLAGFLDNVDQDHLATLKQDQSAYEQFLGEAYSIATANGKRSKLRSITAVMNDALGIAPKEKAETAPAPEVVEAKPEASTEGVLLLVNPIVPGRDMSAEEPQEEAEIAGEEELVDDGMDTFTIAELEEMILKNLG